MTAIRNITEWHCKTELEAQTVLMHCQRTLQAVTPADNQQVKPETNLLTTHARALKLVLAKEGS